MTLNCFRHSAAMCLALGVWASTSMGAFAQDPSGFRGEGEGDWYHPLEVDEWVSLGAKEYTVERILKRISMAQGPRADDEMADTLLEVGPGHWVTEWTNAGDKALSAARSETDQKIAYENARAAVVYYHLASAPHTNDPKQRAALDKAGLAYMVAGRLSEHDVQDISLQHDGKSFGAYVHFPKGEGPFPVIVASNGSDQSKEMLFSYFDTYLADEGIALITVDIPGMGDSAQFDVRDGDTAKLHLTTAAWAAEQEVFQSQNVFIQGGSFGGHAAARAFIASEDYNLAGVISECAPLDMPFKLPPEVYEMLPQFTIDGVRARLGLEAGSDVETFAERVEVMALSEHGMMEGRDISTPLLVISTTEDPVAPLEDLDQFIEQASNVTRIILDEEGHCPDSVSSDLLAADWVLNNLR